MQNQMETMNGKKSEAGSRASAMAASSSAPPDLPETSTKRIWGSFLKIRGTVLGVPTIRMIVYWSLS